MNSEETKINLYGLAKEIQFMTEEEKQFSLIKIIQAEKDKDKKGFWTKIAKIMLIDKEINEKIIHKLDFTTH